MRAATIALLALLASATAAQAMCDDDINNVRLKVERAQKLHPSPQTAAAAKELKRYDERSAMAGESNEIDCGNTVARVERALKVPPPADTEIKLGEAAGPVGERAKSIDEQAKKE